MKSFLNKLKIRFIDVYVYQMKEYKQYDKSNLPYTINKENNKNKLRYYIFDSNIIVHESYLYENVFLLKSLNKKGPVIGDCVTNKRYRGQSIYPYVINYIAKDVLNSNSKEVFVIVNKANHSSIRGIEKAGFSKFASIKTKRWLWFYFNKNIEYFIIK